MIKRPTLFALLSLILLLSGCAPSGSRQAELNQSSGRLSPVSALAIDTHEHGYTMTVESIRQDSLEGDASPAYYSVEAESYDELFDHADEMLASRLYLMHTRTVLISERVAQSALVSLTDSLLGRPDVRLTLRIAITRRQSPSEVLQAEAIAEEIPGVALAGLLDQRASDGILADCPLFRLLDRQERGLAISLPTLRLNDDGHAAPDGSVQLQNGILTYAAGGDKNA